jgi:putrescine transport system permease protein
MDDRQGWTTVVVAVPFRTAAVVRLCGKELVGAAAGYCRALSVVAAVFLRAVPDRLQDFVCGVFTAGAPALRAGRTISGRRCAAGQAAVSTYSYLFHEPLYVSAWLYSLKVAFISTVLCLLVGYPMAYAIARSSPASRNVLLMLIILPFWTSFLLRVYAWIGLLKTDGVINQVLMALHVINEPLAMMNTSFAVYVGIVYSYLPFMILPLYSNLEKHDNTLLEAAQDLGSGPIRAFLRITLPLSVPGIVAGSLLVFIPAVGEYVIPSLLGRSDQLMIAKLLSDEFFLNRNWPNASAVATAMLLLLVVPIMLFQHFQNKELKAAKR